MSEPMKKRPTKQSDKGAILTMKHHHSLYAIPANVAEQYRVKEAEGLIEPEALFHDLHETYGRPACLLNGLRCRENLSQKAMAHKLQMSQADISKMENGKKRIGRTIAKRLAHLFDVNYRWFLD